MNSKPVIFYECNYCHEIYRSEQQANACCVCKVCGKEKSRRTISERLGHFCEECKIIEEKKILSKRLDTASRITLAEYNELHKGDDETGCLFNGNDYLFYQEDGGDGLFDENLVFGTRIVRFRDKFKDDDVKRMVDSWFTPFLMAIEGECYPSDLAVDYEEVIAFLKQWVAKQTAHLYKPDFKTAVIVPPMEEEEEE